ncbi:glycylpeptide N-tetradecanoyltransferase [Microbotryomycetes sp. JL221]|nr:glycylpeptide N-tetradecanoyltransferase [Microbotryomycetes sp. JL221]
MTDTPSQASNSPEAVAPELSKLSIDAQPSSSSSSVAGGSIVAASSDNANIDNASEADGAYSGDLPQFSDDEAEASSSTVKRLPPKPKGPPGRKKVPGGAAAASIKRKLGNVVTPSSASSSSSSKDKPSTEQEPLASTSAAPGGGMKLSDQQLETLIQQLVKESPELDGKITKLDAQKFVDAVGINKSFLQGKSGLMGKGAKDMGSHKFWSTQPVLQYDAATEEIREGPIEPERNTEDIPKEPMPLHKDFKWVTVDAQDPAELKEVYELLTGHYVEDVDASFRFDYAAEFIEWALGAPGFVAEWMVGIRVADTNKLVGFITGVPYDLRVRNITKKFVEINFLCVHKKLRSKRLAPILIQEVTRRCRSKSFFHAIYTAGAYLPTPVTRCQYFHRNLNPAKLVKTGFSAIPRNSSVARMINHYKLPDETKIAGLREIRKGDLKQAGRLLRAYLARFDMAPLLNNKDVEHALWAGRGKDVEGKRVGQVVWTYVVENPETGKITDLFSFYSLPSTATKMSMKTNINAAYLFYYATDQTPSTNDLGDGSIATPVVHWQSETPEQRQVLKERLNALIGDALVISQKCGFDVFNALTLADNKLFLEDLKFGRGDGFLHYYLYNWATKPILGGIDESDGGSGVAVVML